MADYAVGVVGHRALVDGATSVVVLSPHLDDAVFAVGAFIASEAAVGIPVVVETVFTGNAPAAPTARHHRAFSDYSVRRAEDDSALRILGASSRRLGFRERLFRPPPLRTPLHIFRTPPTPEDVESIEVAIHETLSDPGVAVLAPLGIGNHIDHVAVAVAALRCAVGGGRILFYEDFNALSERWRRRHPIARTAPFRWRDAPGWASPVTGLGMEAMSFVSAGPASTDYLGRAVLDEFEWVPCAVPAAGHEQVKIDAIAQYHSQTGILGGERQLSAMIRRSLTRRGGEVVWRLNRRTPL